MSAERAHSKFAASGAERWFQCSASVEASEGQPDRETEWSREGTRAHKVLEKFMLASLKMQAFYMRPDRDHPPEMILHAIKAGNFILKLGAKLQAEVLVETRIYLPFINKEMFGTFDGAVLDHFGTLHVFDFKYGAGHAVSAKENLQMIFYGIGLAHKYHWNFARVRLWVIQPRIKGYDGPTFWDVPIEVLKAYVPKFNDAVWRVENEPEYREGSWCHWCKAKKVCPLKNEVREGKMMDLFKSNPIGGSNEKEKTGQSKESQGLKSEADWRKEAKRKKGKKQKSSQSVVSGEKETSFTYEGITQAANRIARELGRQIVDETIERYEDFY